MHPYDFELVAKLCCQVALRCLKPYHKTTKQSGLVVTPPTTLICTI